ncbi:MAG: Smr/MutS family protein [Bacteroidales bacterium]|nr:Smr/MutS family protein [Bacteroidales bacterium]
MKQLKLGQSVVMMDSNLRGKVVAIGRRVSIELEDGMVIEATYGEFIVTEAEEINALLNSSTSGKAGAAGRDAKLGGSPLGSGKAEIKVDLHIENLPGGRKIPHNQRLPYQLEVFHRILRENLPHRGRQICFVHGHGDGILKAAIRKELDEVYAQRCSYSVGDPAVTLVKIR